MTIEDALRQALADAPRGRVTVPAELHGFPATAHGGAIAALFYRATTPRPPVQLRMELLRGVPTATPLALTTGRSGALARLALAQAGRHLAMAELSREAVALADPAPTLEAWRGDSVADGEVPGSATCLACGPANRLGLALRFRFNARFLWREYAPRDTYRAADGSLHAACVAIALDELGWWLGALAQGECGVTTELVLTVHRRLPFAPILVLGDRTAVRADDDPRGRYVRGRGLVVSEDGRLLAAADIRFGGSRAYTKRLLEPFLETTEREVLFRFFPSARDLSRRAPAP